MVVRRGSAHGRDPVGRRCFVHDVARGVVWWGVLTLAHSGFHWSCLDFSNVAVVCLV
jgi:hypothetical protein